MIYDAERGDIRMVLTGDTMLTCRLAPYKEPDYLRLLELVRSSTGCFDAVAAWRRAIILREWAGFTRPSFSPVSISTAG